MRAFLGLIGSLGLMAAAAADWTGFRGPKSLGVSAEHGLPVTWTGTDNVVWKTKLPGPGSSSPVTSGSRIFLTNAAVESNALLAFDKRNGKQVWKTPGIKGAWGTPVLVEVPGGQQELVLSIPRTILGLDPDTGKELWRCEGIADSYLCPSVVAKDGIVYVVGGRGGIGAIAVKAGGRRDVTTTRRLWTQKVGSRVPSPVLHEGHLYWVNDQGGMANCLKADTGEIVYQQRLPGAGLTYASAVAADGKLYVVTRQGGTYVLAAQPKFTQLARNQIEDDRSIFNASPAVDRGQLLLRSDQYLYCIGAK
jgi:outer membrane protein assembly factor BamB